MLNRINFKVKGKFKGFDQLKTVDLPENAVMFKEPKNMVTLNLMAILFIIPLLVLVDVVFKLKYGAGASMFDAIHLGGAILSLLMIVPHEILHAIAFPEGADVEMWYSIKAMMAFVHSTTPTTKGRFIFMSLLPNVVFGFFPLFIWYVLPLEQSTFTDILFTFSAFSLTLAGGDMMNVFNALVQMPNNAMQQISGFNSYWYIPEE